MDKGSLLLEIKAYFGQIGIERYLLNNPDCLILAFKLVDDLTEINPSFGLVFQDSIDFTSLSEEVLDKILERLKIFDSEMNKFRKLN